MTQNCIMYWYKLPYVNQPWQGTKNFGLLKPCLDAICLFGLVSSSYNCCPAYDKSKIFCNRVAKNV